MLSDVRVRPRSEEDLPGCVLALRAVHASDGYPTWWPEDPGAWLSPREHAVAWIAEDEGAVLGHICVVRGVDDPMVATLAGINTDRLVSVSRLFVSPAARGLGLGAALLGAAASWSWVHDSRLKLDVIDDGAPAVRLYERLGWRLVDRRQADWVTPEGDPLTVRIYLSPAGEGPTAPGSAPPQRA